MPAVNRKVDQTDGHGRDAADGLEDQGHDRRRRSRPADARPINRAMFGSSVRITDGAVSVWLRQSPPGRLSGGWVIALDMCVSSGFDLSERRRSRMGNSAGLRLLVRYNSRFYDVTAVVLPECSPCWECGAPVGMSSQLLISFQRSCRLRRRRSRRRIGQPFLAMRCEICSRRSRC